MLNHISKRVTELFSELKCCREDEQMQKIEEMNELINEMNRDEFKSVFTKELLNKMGNLIEEEKMTWGNSILLLKHVGYCKELKNVRSLHFEESLLNKRFKIMIDAKNEKKEEENENLLINLCECYLLVNMGFSSKIITICVSCLVKVASNKGENKTIQKEVEMALLALNNLKYPEIERKLYLNELIEIIQHHQEHHNLTRLAYQSAFQFLVNRLRKEDKMEDLIVNKLHFIKEAINELEYLTNYLDGKGKEEGKGEKDEKEKLLLIRWLVTADDYLLNCQMWNEETVELIGNVAQIFQAAKNNNSAIRRRCIYLLETAAYNRKVNIEDLFQCGAIDLMLEEIHQQTLKIKILFVCLKFFTHFAIRLKEEWKGQKMKTKRKEFKRQIFDKLEEEGCEDIVTSFHGILMNFLKYELYYQSFLQNFSDYFFYA